MINRSQIIVGDCLEVLSRPGFPIVDLVFGSPPYEDVRTYDIGFALRGQEWVDWMVHVVQSSLKVCRGLVAFVVEGKTRKFRYSCTPILLMADLHRAGVHLRKPPVFHRVGIPGSGGPDWLRNDYEFIVCATNGGRLPWSDNVACGQPCKYPVGGAMSNRTKDGQRRNAKTGKRLHTKRGADGTMRTQGYTAPKKANPGNIISGNVGGGRMGSDLAHENEAPFPEALAEFFAKSFCPVGGTVLDPFSGSGTTAKVAVANKRNAIAIDVRKSQSELTRRRLEEYNSQSPLWPCEILTEAAGE